ncbi:LemA family protein [Ectothiorhodospira mobilis]|uniref:LemA family protein n=1 Tax=Ectothiorhodospira mobilis TaxID=195064 RepID=UPI001903C71B|nr:LemA family protein [Ectothiorhodospira mobilis]MBK1692029.1 LemA family protein [Ectothiorhodospira mobilis]
MDIGGYVMLGMLVLIALYAVLIYNNLVQLKHAVSKAWSNIEVLLKQRHDELPKLVEVCRQYMAYEKETLERVMRARGSVARAQQQGDLASLGRAEDGLRAGLGQLFAVAEAYPELKADGRFQHLEARISGLENAIADRREFYNDCVNRNNVRIEQFPDLVVAHLLRFGPFQLLDFPAHQTRDPDIRALFG